MTYTVLGISSGLGVSLFPFKKHLIGNIEARKIFHTPGNEQWKANFGDIPIIKEDEKDNIPEKLLKGFVDVIISSPDCGSGSIFRYSRAKKLGDHKKNDSLSLFFKGIDKFKPKFFLFENLNSLFTSFPRDEFRAKLPNYRLKMFNGPVSRFGNSQINRKRLVILGIRKDLPEKLDKIFKWPHHKGFKTCKELYGDLEDKENWFRYNELAHIREPYTDTISIHARKRMLLLDIAHEWQNRLKGKKRWATEPEFKFTTAPGVYRNLDNDFPATARKANRQFDELGFTLTPRQLARVQGVPDEFKIYYDPNKSKYWINKGRTVVTKTPPYEISVWFKKKLVKALKEKIEKKKVH